MRQGDLNRRERALGGNIVHILFGISWGAVYSVMRESFEPLNGKSGAVVFGTTVWTVSDLLLLPAFKLGGWPNQYPLKNHLYALGTHLTFAATVWGLYEAAHSLLANGIQSELSPAVQDPSKVRYLREAS